MRTKRLAVDVKAGDGLEPGQFVGYASIFGNVDSYGDVVERGAFAETIKDNDGVFPCYWGHRMDEPLMNIGRTLEVVEDDQGLRVKVQLDVEGNANAAYVHKLIRERRVTQMSFAYEVLESEHDRSADEPVNRLKRVRLHEVSVVPVGANQETFIESVKSADSGVVSVEDLSDGNAEDRETGNAEDRSDGKARKANTLSLIYKSLKLRR